MNENMNNLYMPHTAEIVERIQEATNVFTLRLRFIDPQIHRQYRFMPGQFNMVYLYGVGEVAISISSDPRQSELYDHTIRVVGRVTRGLAQLKQGDHVGIRGPYGRGWPIDKMPGKDVVIITGGLGCAPVVMLINYIMQRRDQFGRLCVLQGVKNSDDLIFRDYYRIWAKLPSTQIKFAADQSSKAWSGYVGHPTDLIKELQFDADNAVAMICGPEIMMHIAVQQLLRQRLSEENIYLSMERSMQCAIAHCGHCQYGGQFVCKDGPVFSYPQVKALFNERGY
jgi:sulfhydrogenase subunit gamma (sulfur reductase)